MAFIRIQIRIFPYTIHIDGISNFSILKKIFFEVTFLIFNEIMHWTKNSEHLLENFKNWIDVSSFQFLISSHDFLRLTEFRMKKKKQYNSQFKFNYIEGTWEYKAELVWVWSFFNIWNRFSPKIIIEFLTWWC